MSRSIRTATGVAIISMLAAVTVVFAAPGSAQVTPALNLTPTGETMLQSGTASIVGTLTVACDSLPTAADVDVMIGGAPAPSVAVTILTPSTFTLSVPAGLTPTSETMGPVMEVTITCPIDTVSTPVSDTISYGEIHVMKDVVGNGPAAGQFPMQAVCTPMALTDGAMFVPAADGPAAAPGTFEFTLTDGSGHSIFTFSPYTCVVSETDSLGAAEVAVIPDTVSTTEAKLYFVEVVNAYPTAPSAPRFTG
ncbi:MAG: hypothetical protein FGM58_01215 [Acidimicrobiia bacterium]|nr:hypothetical protein [Acidimicrobiia bacterium]